MEDRMDDSICPGMIRDYLTGLIPERSALLREMEAYAKAHHVPIAQPETAQLLSVLTAAVKPKKILEIGTAIGYSALIMEDACGGEAEILTIEQSYERIVAAKEYLRRAGHDGRVKIVGGDALEVLPQLQDRYGLIFLDASKGHYLAFLPELLRLLQPGGMLICDNVLYHGMVASGESEIRRDKTIVRRLREFLDVISHHPQLGTSVLPVGDGVSISCKLCG